MALRPTLSSAPGGHDRRRTTCSICRYGIFEGQDTQWSRKPLGLVHTECAEALGAQNLEAARA